MPDSSILGGEKPQPRAGGRDTDALGPSDSSDSGSDIQGEAPMATGPDQPDELGAVPVNTEADSDRTGTGERSSATGDAVEGNDILPDRIASNPNADHGRRESSQLDSAGDALDAGDLAARETNGVQGVEAEEPSRDKPLAAPGS